MADFLFAPQGKDTREAVQCDTEGAIPDWLSGSLYRIGPGQFYHGQERYTHLFDGIAFLHKYAIKEGKVTYQNRKLESECYKRSESAQRLVVTGFGHVAHPDPCKSIFSRYFTHFFGTENNDNDNVNVILAGDQLYSVSETSGMTCFNKQTLENTGRVIDCKNKLFALNRHTAHPQYERDGSIINIGTLYSGKSMYGITKIPPKERGEEEMVDPEDITLVASIPARWPRSPCYFHSFGMTENYYVVIEQTVSTNVFGLLCMKLTRKSFKDALTFHQNEKSLFHIIDKKTGKEVSNKYYGPAFFLFHHINAYEEDNNVIIDFCGYGDIKIIEELMLDNLAKDYAKDLSEVWRFALPMNISETAATGDNLLSDGSFTGSAVLQGKEKGVCNVFCTPHKTGAFMELPRINYDFNGKKYRYSYGTTVFPTENEQAMLKKVDMETGKILTWCDEGCRFIGEPVFVASPESNAEDDGVLLVPLIAQKEGQKSSLLILNAKRFTEIARAISPVEVKVPFTFHGEFDTRN